MITNNIIYNIVVDQLERFLKVLSLCKVGLFEEGQELIRGGITISETIPNYVSKWFKFSGL